MSMTARRAMTLRWISEVVENEKRNGNENGNETRRLSKMLTYMLHSLRINHRIETKEFLGRGNVIVRLFHKYSII